jgi:hypothetical protein
VRKGQLFTYPQLAESIGLVSGAAFVLIPDGRD